jgi:hypothetical protein
MDRTALHEAGHAWMALRCGWSARAASVKGGTASAGCTLYRRHGKVNPAGVNLRMPFALWPAGVRDELTHRAMITMAGDVAEQLIYVAEDEPLAVRAADQIADLPDELPGPDPRDLLTLAVAMDDPDGPDDARLLAEFAHAAHGSDHMSASSWLAHIADQCIHLVATDEAKIERLAAGLARDGELGAEAIRAILAA